MEKRVWTKKRGIRSFDVRFRSELFRRCQQYATDTERVQRFPTCVSSILQWSERKKKELDEEKRKKKMKQEGGEKKKKARSRGIEEKRKTALQ